MVVVVYRSSVFHIWYYGDIYRKLIAPFQWLSSSYLKKIESVQDEEAFVKWVGVLIIWLYTEVDAILSFVISAL